jgi:hypothetical protein
MMVIYATPPLFFVVLLPPNLNAAPILTRPRVPDQNPSAGAAQASIFRCYQPIPDSFLACCARKHESN